MKRIRTILVPTDFSGPAEAAWRYAQMLADEFKARIHLLHVISPPFVYDAWGTDAAAINTAEMLSQFEASARAQLKRLAATAGRRTARVTTATSAGLTVAQILDYIARHRVDLVVIGTHGRGMVGHMLLGSVAERVVQHSPVPVLSVHGPKDKPARGRKRASTRR